MRETFLRNGELGRRLLDVDWAGTALGSPDDWPRSLQTVVRMLLASKFSMWMAWGPDLTFFCNDAYRRDTLGAKYPWALGRRASEVWSEIWPEIGPRIDHVLTTGEATWDENLKLFLERSGYREETYHTFSYSPLSDDSGATVGMLCVVAETTDEVISRRRLATLRDLGAGLADQLTEEQTVAAASAVLAGAVDDVPFHLVLVDRGDGPRLVAQGGAAVDTPLGRQLADGSWTPAGADEGPVLLERLPGSALPGPGAPDRAVVVPIHGTKESSYGHLVVGLSPFLEYDAAYRDFLQLVSGHLGAAITDARAYDDERRRAESLAELDRAKTEFFTNVSHEFRTPLTLLLGPLEDALGDTGEPLAPPQRERLDLARRNALRLLKLVNNLLSFSGLESGRAQAAFEPVDLATYTRDLASMFRSSAEQLGLSYTVECDPLPESVYVDRELWAQVVLNLLSNAMKFTLEGGVAVELRAEGDHAVLAVRDTGVGIPPEQQGELFQRFRRLAPSESRSHEGSGIGLALVAEVARLHGGAATVRSAPGEGATFAVTVPFGSSHLPPDQVISTGRSASARMVEGFQVESRQLAGPSGRASERDGQATRADAAGGGRPRVLVVDDNADVRQYVTTVLSGDYQVLTAVDGLDALERVVAERPDLVLTDVMMPNLDGLGLLAELRSRPETTGIPVVMLSARGGDDARVGGLEAGADDYLVKPFAAAELRARVRASLDLDRTRRARDELERHRELLDEAQRFARLGSWSYDLTTGRLETSPELLRIMETDESALRQAGYPDFLLSAVHPDDRELVGAVLAEARPGDEIGFDTRLVRPDGTLVHVSVHGELVQGAGGLVARGSLQDVTERRRAAESVALAQAAAEVAAREHQIAAELQSSLLPERVFDLKQLDVSTFYRPGQEGTEVGGDWYDVIELEGGRTALVMGDVMGHGVHAAAVMGQLRTAFRAYARLGMPPQPLMESVDELVCDLFPDQIVTCVYGEFDPDQLTVSLLSAGHVPPLVITPGGASRRVEGEVHPPLGVGRPFPQPETVSLAPGEGILLYTDGLVERRDRDIERGIQVLQETADRLGGPLVDLPSRLVGAMLPDGPQDDVALLLAEVPPALG